MSPAKPMGPDMIWCGMSGEKKEWSGDENENK